MTERHDTRTDRRTGPIREEAALWFARLRGANAQVLRPAFEDWLARDPRHLAEYNRITEIFAFDRRARTHPGRNWLLAAALGIIVAGGSIRFLPGPTGSQPERASSDAPSATAEWRSDAGSTRTLALADGSRVVLDSDSEIRLRFDAGHRAVILTKGRARFDVAHERRPFTVTAGGTTVTARGTLFDVAVTPGRRPRVALFRGAVDVDIVIEGRHARTRLAPGQQVTGAPGAPASPSPIADVPDQDWPDAVFDYDATPLDRVVADANRYALRPIMLDRPDLASILVSGHFRVSDGNCLADRLAAVFGLSVDRSDPARLILRRPPIARP